jgi:hypothetical protein
MAASRSSRISLLNLHGSLSRKEENILENVKYAFHRKKH